MRLPVHSLSTATKELDLGEAKAYHLPNWHSMSHPERLVVMRQVAMMRGRDPRIAKLAVKIVKRAKAKPRDYRRQAAALLKWVQNPKNCYYVNEPGERLQDPIYTLKVKHGDCDDMVILLCSLFESINLPWKQVLSGRSRSGKKIRYIEGAPLPDAESWAHVYCMVGTPPFRPTAWYFCEPTVQGVPLGWDVVDGDHRYLPEMAKQRKGKPIVVPAPPPRWGFKPSKLPKGENRSPAYAMAYGSPAYMNSGVSSAIGASVAAEMDDQARADQLLDWKKVAGAIATGVAVSVGTQIVLDWVRGRGIWQEKGNVVERWRGKLIQVDPVPWVE